MFMPISERIALLSNSMHTQGILVHTAGRDELVEIHFYRSEFSEVSDVNLNAGQPTFRINVAQLPPIMCDSTHVPVLHMREGDCLRIATNRPREWVAQGTTKPLAYNAPAM